MPNKLEHVHQKRKKHKGRSVLLSASTTYLLHPTRARLRQVLQRAFAASLLTAGGCRQDIPKASGTGKLHVNASLTLARKEKKRELPCSRRPEHVLQTCDTEYSKTRRTIYTIQTVKCKRIFQGSWSCHHLRTHCAYYCRISQNVHTSQHGEITGLNLGRLRVQKD